MTKTPSGIDFNGFWAQAAVDAGALSTDEQERILETQARQLAAKRSGFDHLAARKAVEDRAATGANAEEIAASKKSALKDFDRAFIATASDRDPGEFREWVKNHNDKIEVSDDDLNQARADISQRETAGKPARAISDDDRKAFSASGAIAVSDKDKFHLSPDIKNSILYAQSAERVADTSWAVAKERTKLEGSELEESQKRIEAAEITEKRAMEEINRQGATDADLKLAGTQIDGARLVTRGEAIRQNVNVQQNVIDDFQKDAQQFTASAFTASEQAIGNDPQPKLRNAIGDAKNAVNIAPTTSRGLTAAPAKAELTPLDKANQKIAELTAENAALKEQLQQQQLDQSNFKSPQIDNTAVTIDAEGVSVTIDSPPAPSSAPEAPPVATGGLAPAEKPAPASPASGATTPENRKADLKPVQDFMTTPDPKTKMGKTLKRYDNIPEDKVRAVQKKILEDLAPEDKKALNISEDGKLGDKDFVDGKWGAKTDEALRTWQKKHDLRADGVWGPRSHSKAVYGKESGEMLEEFKEPFKAQLEADKLKGVHKDIRSDEKAATETSAPIPTRGKPSIPQGGLGT